MRYFNLEDVPTTIPWRKKYAYLQGMNHAVRKINEQQISKPDNPPTGGNSKSSSKPDNPPPKPPKDRIQLQAGWVCPKCGAVYNPSVWACPCSMKLTCGTGDVVQPYTTNTSWNDNSSISNKTEQEIKENMDHHKNVTKMYSDGI